MKTVHEGILHGSNSIFKQKYDLLILRKWSVILYLMIYSNQCLIYLYIIIILMNQMMLLTSCIISICIMFTNSVLITIKVEIHDKNNYTNDTDDTTDSSSGQHAQLTETSDPSIRISK